MHISGRQFMIGAVALVVTLLGVQQYTKSVVARELNTTQLALEATIAKQEVVLATVADLTKQNNADEITERIVVDCKPADRERFELLLNKLSDTISRTELLDLERLFLDCGSFFADRKSVMAARLDREVSVFNEYVALRNRILSVDDGLVHRGDMWQQVAVGEVQLAKDFSYLVELQRDIIMALLAGKTRDSVEITSTLKEVTDLKNMMTVRVQQIESIRKELLVI